jgi:hypothetical protein
MNGMIFLHGNSAWKLVLLVVVLAFFAFIGVAHVINPDSFIRRSGVRKGGEMLTEWNRLGFQIVGALLAGFAVYGIYSLLEDVLSP